MKVKVIKAGLPSYWYAEKIGEVFEVEPYDKNSAWPYKLISDNTYGSYFDKDDVEIIFEEKVMKREDKINLEITLQEAAQIYALIGRSNGTVGYDVYKTIKEVIDPTREAYDKCIDGKFELIHYIGVQREFEAALFDKKTPAQIELESLQTKISELQAQAEKLQNIINK